MKVNKQLIFLSISSALVLTLGSIGFYQFDPDKGKLTSIYLAAQLFVMNSGVVDSNETPILIEISRWLALATLVTAVYASAQAILGHLKSTLRIAFIKNHAVICGAGIRGNALASAFQSIGQHQVVVIEIDESNASIGELRNQGIEVVIGNAVDASILQRAGISRAHSLVAVTGDDERNLSICTEVATKLNVKCELSAGIESWSWKNYFLDRMKSKIRLDSYMSRAARGLLLNLACTAIKKQQFRQKNIHLLLDVSDQHRQEFLRAAIMMLQIAGDQKPVIDLTSVGPGQKESFVDRFPAHELVAELRWHSNSASQVFPENHNGSSPDFAIFALNTDIETLEAAEKFWMRHSIPDEHVIACLQSESDATNLENFQRKKRDFTVIHLLKFGIGSKDPLESDIESNAKICHSTFIHSETLKRNNYGSMPGDLPSEWHALPERLKESNRLAAMHHEVKRSAWSSKDHGNAEEFLTYLSRCEHMRWMAEKAMEGWRWSGSLAPSDRDNEKLRHPMLIHYDALSNPEKDKDFNAFLWALDLAEDEVKALNLSEDAQRMLEFSKLLKA